GDVVGLAVAVVVDAVAGLDRFGDGDGAAGARTGLAQVGSEPAMGAEGGGGVGAVHRVARRAAALARPGIGQVVVGGAVAVVADVVAVVGAAVARLGGAEDAPRAGLGAPDALVGAERAVGATSGVGAIREVPGRARAAGLADPRVGRAVVGHPVAVVVLTVA